MIQASMILSVLMWSGVGDLSRESGRPFFILSRPSTSTLSDFAEHFLGCRTEGNMSIQYYASRYVDQHEFLRIHIWKHHVDMTLMAAASS